MEWKNLKIKHSYKHIILDWRPDFGTSWLVNPNKRVSFQDYGHNYVFFDFSYQSSSGNASRRGSTRADVIRSISTLHSFLICIPPDLKSAKIRFWSFQSILLDRSIDFYAPDWKYLISIIHCDLFSVKHVSPLIWPGIRLGDQLKSLDLISSNIPLGMSHLEGNEERRLAVQPTCCLAQIRSAIVIKGWQSIRGLTLRCSHPNAR